VKWTAPSPVTKICWPPGTRTFKELASPLRTVRLPGGQPDDKGQVEAVWPFRKNVRLDAVIMRLSTGVPGALALTWKGIPAVWFPAAANAVRRESIISLMTGIVAGIQ
jgi:hypothetical protein